MDASQALARPGLRERKKQQTREKIAQVALALFAERGYEKTTLADIAEAADVSPRTIFAYYPGKEEILFCGESSFYEQLEQALEERPPEATTVDVLRDFLSETGPIDEDTMLRKRIVSESEELRLVQRARRGRLEDLVARSIGRDLGDVGPDDLRPVL